MRIEITFFGAKYDNVLIELGLYSLRLGYTVNPPLCLTK